MEKLYNRSEILASMEGAYIATDQKGIRVLDPVFKEPIKPFRPPRCIEEDPHLGTGLAQLARMAAQNRIAVQLVLAPHGSATDFKAASDHFGSVLEAAPVIGIEANWQATGERAPEEFPQYDLVLTEDPKRRAFQEAQYSYLTNTGSPRTLLPCDFEINASSPTAQHVLKLWAMYEAATRNSEGLDPAAQNRARAATTIACQALRHWALIGQFGHWLHLLDKEGGLPDRVNHVPFMLGNWHAPSQRRLSEYLGVPTRTYLVQEHTTQEYTNYGELFMHAVAHGRATHEQLDFKLPF